MRNFCSPVVHVLSISTDTDPSQYLVERREAEDVILSAMDSTADNLTPSEEFCIDSFRAWFASIRGKSNPYSGNTVERGWTYVNLNEGITIVFVANDFDYEERAWTNEDWSHPTGRTELSVAKFIKSSRIK